MSKLYQEPDPMWKKNRDEDEHQSLVRLGVIQSFPGGMLLPTQGTLPDGKWAWCGEEL